MLTAIGIDGDNGFTAPTALGTLGAWTGVTGGPDLTNIGGNAEFNLSASGATGVNFTCGGSGDNYIALSAAYK
jgi:hypothetical protein